MLDCIYLLCNVCIFFQVVIIGLRHYFFDILDKKINNMVVTIHENKMLEFYVEVNFICNILVTATVVLLSIQVCYMLIIAFFKPASVEAALNIFNTIIIDSKIGFASIIMFCLDIVWSRLVINPLKTKIKKLPPDIDVYF